MAVTPLKKILDGVPVRCNLWFMLLTSCWAAYMLRVNMSLNLIAMVPAKPSTRSGGLNDVANNRTIRQVSGPLADIPFREGSSNTFDWSEEKQALILGSYFWSYPVTSLFGGMAAERWGPRYIVFASSLASGILTALCPIAAKWHYMALVVLRFLLGFCGGFVYPALHALVARWAPPAEKGKFISAMMGGTLGTVVTWSLTGPLMHMFGWESAFYVPAVIMILWCFLWRYLVADTPASHPRITDNEKKYILEALGNKVQASKGLPPFKQIAMSIPFLAMVVLHFGNLWGLYFIMTAGPKFVSTVLGFDLKSAGFIAALPYLARMFLAMMFGAIGDYILGRNLMKKIMIRKSFTVCSHIVPGLLLVLLVYVGKSTGICVALITMSMGFNGAATLTNLQNHQDLAPNFAGTLYGIANSIGSTAGFFTPIITAYFTKEGNSFDNWRPVFYVGASVYIVTAIFFIIFGSAKTQSWNYANDSQEEPIRDQNEMKGAPAPKGKSAEP